MASGAVHLMGNLAPEDDMVKNIKYAVHLVSKFKSNSSAECKKLHISTCMTHTVNGICK